MPYKNNIDDVSPQNDQTTNSDILGVLKGMLDNVKDLRKDIQDLRNQVQDVRDNIDGVSNEVRHLRQDTNQEFHDVRDLVSETNRELADLRSGHQTSQNIEDGSDHHVVIMTTRMTIAKTNTTLDLREAS